MGGCVGLFVQLPASTGYPSTVTMLEHTAAGGLDIWHVLDLDLMDCRGVVFGWADEPLVAKVAVVSVHHAILLEPTENYNQALKASYNRDVGLAGYRWRIDSSEVEIVSSHLKASLVSGRGRPLMNCLRPRTYLVCIFLITTCHIATEMAHLGPWDT